MSKKQVYRIAQIGTFDVENYGDILFPDVFKNNINRLNLEIELDIFSPRGNCNKPFTDWHVFPISQLEQLCREKKYDALVIGGGDLICLSTMISHIYADVNYHSYDIWQIPILLGEKYNIPVIWNAPGVPFHFSQNERALVQDFLKASEYVAVRDTTSKEILECCGDAEIQVVPDTVFSLERLYHKNDMLNLQKELYKQGKIPFDTNYIVFQHNISHLNDTKYIECIKEFLKQVVEQTDYQVLLFPIGYIHQDENFLQKLNQINTARIKLLNGKLDTREMTAVLAASSGYVGTSMHGAVVSYVYDKMALCINAMKLCKIKGVLMQMGHPEWEITEVSELFERFREEISRPVQFDESLLTEIDEHFKKIQDIIITGRRKESWLGKELLERFYQINTFVNDRRDQVMEVANVYYDYGNGYNMENMVQIPYTRKEGEYYLNWEIPVGVKEVRIDPVEDQILMVDNVQLTLDKQPANVHSSCELKINDKQVLLSLDPSYTVPVGGEELLEFSMKAYPMDRKQLVELLGSFNMEKLVLAKQVEDTQLSLREQKDQENKLMQEVENAKKELQLIRQELTEKDQQIQQTQSALCSARQEVAEKEQQVQDAQSTLIAVRQELSEKEQHIEDIHNSFTWKITRPLYHMGQALRKLMHKTSFTTKAYKALSVLRHKGFGELKRAFKRYLEKRAQKKEIAALTGLPVDQVKLPNNKDGYAAYDADYQDNQDFTGQSTDVKMLAFYLPQFHTFPENDEWWGKGFTEWTNVRSGDSRFPGHYQPRVPHKDIGYYSLEDIDTMRKQAELAKQHGIYGFCFYYYWFSGKRLMEKPVDMLLEHPEIDLPFCLCWANENWTRAWDGQNKHVLIGQEYSDADDERFMRDMKKYIDDPRYIRIHGKPLVMAYNPGHIPDCHKSFATWRRVAKEIGLGEILIWTCQTANNTAEILKITDCIDAEVEFPPHNMWLESIAVRDMELNGKSAFLYNYQCLVDYLCEKLKKNEPTPVPVHHSCMMAWDNAARRKNAWFTYYAFSLKSLYRWVLAIADRARKDFDEEERFVFVNAWNEWGEGTYLEPDEKYGYANINTVAKALFRMPLNDDLQIVDLDSSVVDAESFDAAQENPRIAVQVHMFYLDTLDETIRNLNYLPYAFDCFVTTDTPQKAQQIQEAFEKNCRCRNVTVDVMKNRGRDVAPFLQQMAPVVNNYEYFCHIHSKKTRTNDHGNEWRTYIFKHLFGSEAYLKRLFACFENDKQLGLIMPETYPVLELQAEWGGNREGCNALLRRMGIAKELPEVPVFPVGNMFWARSAAVKRLFQLGLTQMDFPAEAGQVNATIAHQIERCWVYIAQAAGYHYCKLFNNCPIPMEVPQKKRLGIYVHYDVRNILVESDVDTLRVFSGLCDELVFVSNSKLAEEELEPIRSFVNRVESRENIGLDFGAWRDMLLKLGKEKVLEFDELVLFNNSFFAPLYDLNQVFAQMEQRNVDFWGNTIFPYSPDGDYIKKDCIPEHIQSYFMVFHRNVVESDTFWNFWQQMPDYTSFIDVVANCESQFTKKLVDAGFKCEPYLKESYYMSRFLNNYALLYEKPVSMLLLGNAFTKKKCYQYMSEEEKIRLEYLVKKISPEHCWLTEEKGEQSDV